MSEQAEHVIGEWRFDASGATLNGPHGPRRLEHRAARTLDILCRRRGETVPAADILQQVWNGRAVSTNSVAVVIGDLRRSLGDDTHELALIVTVPKRGYRLSQQVEPRTPAPVADGVPRRRAAVLGIGALALVALAGAGVVAMSSGAASPRTQVTVLPVANETGRRELAPLALALGELVTNRLSRGQDLKVVPAAGTAEETAEGGRIRLASRLILWNDEPTLSMTATDAADGAVIWSGMAAGPADSLAGSTMRKVDDLSRKLEKPDDALP